MPKEKIEVEVDVPDGYELTGTPRCGKFYVGYGDTTSVINALITVRKIEPEIRTAWVNMYPKGYGWAYTNRELADKFAGPGRVACVEIKYEVPRPVSQPK